MYYSLLYCMKYLLSNLDEEQKHKQDKQVVDDAQSSNDYVDDLQHVATELNDVIC